MSARKAPPKMLFEELPFVHKPNLGSKKKQSNWDVPPTDDYCLANIMGARYAASYVQYLVDNSDVVGAGMMGCIIRDMDFNDETGAKGYAVGFFAYLERLLHAQARAMDVLADNREFNNVETYVNWKIEAIEREQQEQREQNL